MTNTETEPKATLRVSRRNVVAAVRPGADGEFDFWLSPGLKAAIKNSSPPRVNVRVTEAVAKAAEVLGDHAAAVRWLYEPSRGFGGRTPHSCLDSDDGLELVLAVLVRLEHGVFS